MNRHSRVLPFPQGKGKEKDKSSQNSNGVKSHLTGSTIASSSRGVAKSGIKGVKGLVSSLSVSAKAASHTIKEKHGAQSVAPSISAAVAASDVVPSRTQNKAEASVESRPATRDAKDVRLASNIPEQHSTSAKTATPSFKTDSSNEGTPITDVKSLELVQTCSSSTVTVPTTLASPTSKEVDESGQVQSSPCAGHVEDECTGNQVEEVREPLCNCPSDKENCGCSASSKGPEKSSPVYISVVGKNKVDESVRETFKMRLLCPDDVPEVKALCGDWFPVE